jgi:hypothetical protein
MKALPFLRTRVRSKRLAYWHPTNRNRRQQVFSRYPTTPDFLTCALPERGEPRDKWLTRGDAAKLIWTCWRYREMQKMSRGPMKGLKVPTGKEIDRIR